MMAIAHVIMTALIKDARVQTIGKKIIAVAIFI